MGEVNITHNFGTQDPDDFQNFNIRNPESPRAPAIRNTRMVQILISTVTSRLRSLTIRLHDPGGAEVFGDALGLPATNHSALQTLNIAENTTSTQNAHNARNHSTIFSSAIDGSIRGALFTPTLRHSKRNTPQITIKTIPILPRNRY